MCCTEAEWAGGGDRICPPGDVQYVPSWRHWSLFSNYWLLLQPSVLLALSAATPCCWFMFSLLSRRFYKADLWPNIDQCMGLVLPVSRTLHLSLLNFVWFLLAHAYHLDRSLWMAALSFNVWCPFHCVALHLLFFLAWCHPQTPKGWSSVSSSRTDKVLKWTGPGMH